MRKVLLAAALALACVLPCHAEELADQSDLLVGEINRLREIVAELDSHYINIANMCLYVPDGWELAETGDTYVFTFEDSAVSVSGIDFTDLETLADATWGIFKKTIPNAFMGKDGAEMIDESEEVVNGRRIYMCMLTYTEDDTPYYVLGVTVDCRSAIDYFSYVTIDEELPASNTFSEFIDNTMFF